MAGEGGVYISIGGGVQKYLIESLAQLKKTLQDLGKTRTPKVDVDVGSAVDNISKFEHEADGLFDRIVANLEEAGEGAEASLEGVVKAIAKTVKEVEAEMNAFQPETPDQPSTSEDPKLVNRLELYKKLYEDLKKEIGANVDQTEQLIDIEKEASRRAQQYTEQLVRFYRVLQEIQQSKGIEFDVLKNAPDVKAFTDAIADSEEKIKDLMRLDLDGYLKQTKNGYQATTEAAREFLGITKEEMSKLQDTISGIKKEFDDLSSISVEDMEGFDSRELADYEQRINDVIKQINKYKDTLEVSGHSARDWLLELKNQKKELSEVRKGIDLTEASVNNMRQKVSDLASTDLEFENAKDGLKGFETSLERTIKEVEKNATALGRRDLLEPLRESLEESKQRLNDFKDLDAWEDLESKIAKLKEESEGYKFLSREEVSDTKSRVTRVITQLNRLRDQGKISGDIFDLMKQQLVGLKEELNEQQDVLNKQKSAWKTQEKLQEKAAEAAEKLRNEVERLSEESKDFEFLSDSQFSGTRGRISSLRSILNKYREDFEKFGTVSRDEIDGLQRKIDSLDDTLTESRTEYKRAMESFTTDKQKEAFQNLFEVYGEGTEKIKNYKKALKETEQAYDAQEVYLKQHIDDLESVTNRSQEQERALAELQEEYRKLANKEDFAADALKRYEDNTIKTLRKQKDFKDNLIESDRHLGFFGKSLTRIGKRIKQFGAFLVAAFVVQHVVQGIQELIQVVKEYDQALHNLQAILEITAGKSQVLGDRIQQVAQQTKFSSTEVAQGVQTLGQAGLAVEESILALDGVTTLATGTLSNFQTVADLVTSTLNAFQLEATESSRIADVFANAINNSKLTVDKLTTSFNYVGAAGHQAGLSLNELTGVMMTLADNGMRASTIGTGLRRMLLKMLDPSEDVAANMKAVGLNLDDLNPKVVGVEKAFANLVPLLWDTERQTVDMQRAVEMFGTRAAQVAAIVVSNMASQEDAIGRAIEKTRELGAASEMAETQQKGLGLMIKNLTDRLKNIAIAAGEAGATGVLKDVIQALQELAGIIRDFIKNNEFALEIAGWTSAITTLVFGVSGLNTIMQKMIAKGYFTKLAAKINVAKMATLGLYTAIISGLVIAFDKLLSRSQEAVDQSQKAAAELAVLNDQAQSWGKMLEGAFATSEWENTVAKFKESFKDVGNIHQNLAYQIENGTKEIGGSVEGLGYKIEDIAGKEGLLQLNKTIHAIELESFQKRLDETGDAVKELQISASNMSKFGIDFGNTLGQMTSNFGPVTDIMNGFANSVQWVVKETGKIFGLDIPVEGIAEKFLDIFGWDKQEMIDNYNETLRETIQTFQEFSEREGWGLGELTAQLQKFRQEQELSAESQFWQEMTEGLAAERFSPVIAELNRIGVSLRQVAKDDATAEEALKQHRQTMKDAEGALQEVIRGNKDLSEVYTMLKSRLTVDQWKKVQAAIEGTSMSFDQVQNRVATFRDKLYEYAPQVMQKFDDMTTIQQYEAAQGFDEIKQEVADYTNYLAKETDKSGAEQLRLVREYKEKKVKEWLDEAADTKEVLEEMADNAKDKYKEITESVSASFDARREETNRYFDWENKKIKESTQDEIQQQQEILENERRRKDKLLQIVDEEFAQRVRIAKRRYNELARIYKDDANKQEDLAKEANDEVKELSEETFDKRKEVLEDWQKDLEKAYEYALDKEEEYADKIKEYQEEIKELRKEAADEMYKAEKEGLDELRDIRRASMSEEEQQLDKLREAREKVAEANKLMNEGTAESIEKAKGLYEDARDIYSDLAHNAIEAKQHNKELSEEQEEARRKAIADGEKQSKTQEKINELEKDRKQIVVSEAEAVDELKQAQEGYEQAVKRGYEVREETIQKNLDKAQEMKDKWAEMADTTKQKIKSVVNALNEINEVEIQSKEANIDINDADVRKALQNAKELARELRDIDGKTFSYNVVVNKTSNEKFSTGGFVSSVASRISDTVKKMNSGGMLPGYGGGDRIKALLESGEFVMRKEAVKQYGRGFFEALNNMMLPQNTDMSGAVKMQTGGYVQPSGGPNMNDMSNFGKIELSVGGRAYPVMAQKNVLDELKKDLTRQKMIRRNS